MEIKIYQLANGEQESEIPLLLNKLYSEGRNVFVIVKSEEEKILIDKKLWSFASMVFLPHGTDLDPMQDQQPIFISNSIESNPSNAEIACFYGDFSFADVKTYCEKLSKSTSFASLKTIIYMFRSDLPSKESVIDLKSQTKNFFNNPQIFYYLKDKNWNVIDV